MASAALINSLIEACHRSERCADFDLQSHLIKLEEFILHNKINFNQSALGIVSAAQIYGYKVDHLRALCLNFQCTQEENDTASNNNNKKHKLDEKAAAAEKAKRLRTKISDGCYTEYRSKEFNQKSLVQITDTLIDDDFVNDQQDCEDITDILTRLNSDNSVYEQITLLQKIQSKDSRPRLKDKDDKLGLEKDSRENYSVFSGYISPDTGCIISCNEYERELLEDKEICLLAMPDTHMQPTPLPINKSLVNSHRTFDSSVESNVVNDDDVDDHNNDCDISSKVPDIENAMIATDADATAITCEIEPSITICDTTATTQNDSTILPESTHPTIIDDTLNNTAEPFPFPMSPHIISTEQPIAEELLSKNKEIRQSFDTGIGSSFRQSVGDNSDNDFNPIVLLDDVLDSKCDVDFSTNINNFAMNFSDEPLVINFLKLPLLSVKRCNFSLVAEFRLTKRKHDENLNTDKVDRNLRKIARIDMFAANEQHQRRQSIDFIGFQTINNDSISTKIDLYNNHINLIESITQNYFDAVNNILISENDNIDNNISIVDDEIVSVRQSTNEIMIQNKLDSQISCTDSGIFSLNASEVNSQNESSVNETTTEINPTDNTQNFTNESIHDSGFCDDDNPPKTSTPRTSIIPLPELNLDDNIQLSTSDQYAQKAIEIQEMEERVRVWHESLRNKMSTFERDYDVKVISNDIKRVCDEKPNGITFDELMKNFDVRYMGRYYWSVLQLANQNEIILHHEHASTVCEWSDILIVRSNGNGEY